MSEECFIGKFTCSKFLSIQRFYQYLSVFLLLSMMSAQVNARGLPEFTELIEKRSPAVVKINTTERKRSQRQMPFPHQEIPDIFRHLFDRGTL